MARRGWPGMTTWAEKKNASQNRAEKGILGTCSGKMKKKRLPLPGSVRIPLQVGGGGPETLPVQEGGVEPPPPCTPTRRRQGVSPPQQDFRDSLQHWGSGTVVRGLKPGWVLREKPVGFGFGPKSSLTWAEIWLQPAQPPDFGHPCSLSEQQF